MQRVCAGGFPLAVHRPERGRNRWFGNYVKLTLERDVADLANLRQRDKPPGFLKSLAGQTAQATWRSEKRRSVDEGPAAVKEGHDGEPAVWSPTPPPDPAGDRGRCREHAAHPELTVGRVKSTRCCVLPGSLGNSGLCRPRRKDATTGSLTSCVGDGAHSPRPTWLLSLTSGVSLRQR